MKHLDLEKNHTLLEFLKLIQYTAKYFICNVLLIDFFYYIVTNQII